MPLSGLQSCLEVARGSTSAALVVFIVQDRINAPVVGTFEAILRNVAIASTLHNHGSATDFTNQAQLVLGVNVFDYYVPTAVYCTVESTEATERSTEASKRSEGHDSDALSCIPIKAIVASIPPPSHAVQYMYASPWLW